MIITYEIENNLYVNLTNKCSNSCDFCVRENGVFQHNLWLEKEPTVDEIVKDIFSRDLSKYSQLVFCGFGEPLERIDDVLSVAKLVKSKSSLKVRINTNGQANLIHNHDVTPKFEKLIDSLSISLNASNNIDYDNICHSIFGLEAFSSVLDFTQKSKKYVPYIQLTVVDCISETDILACKKVAESLGVNFKIRFEVK